LERRLLLSGTLPSYAQPSPNAVYYTGGTSGAMTLDVTAGTIAFNANVADDGSDWQNLTIEASGSAHLIFNSPQTLSFLGLVDNATVTVSQGNNGAASNLLQLNTLVVNPTATLDLGDNAMILYYQPSEQSSDLSTIQSLLKSGYNGGAWNGTGINSSSAANDPSKDTSLGYMDNNDFQSPYAGINFTQFNQIIVGYTYYGDVDLNRYFDSTDVNQLIAGRSVPGGGWEYGDFNYDGQDDNTDTTIFLDEQHRWQQQLIDTGQYTPAFRLSPLPIQPDWNTPFDGDIATFTDTVNTNLPASDYLAEVYWGDGTLSIAQVTATDTPGSFRINAISPVFTTANPIMLMTLQYADGSGYQSESAIAGEPIDVLQLPPGVNASANAVYSISGASGNVHLNLTAGSLSFDTNASNDSNYFQNLNFTVSGSAHAYFNSPEDFNALTIQGNAIVSLSRGGGGANGNRLNVQSLSIDPNATLDLADNALIDWYAIGGGAAARSQMQSWVQSGYANGAWTGHGIVSSLAADDTTSALGVGWMDNGYDYVDHSIDPSYTTFAGVNLQLKNQMLVRLAYYGDANLDGQVDDTDLYLWNSGYNHNGYTGWVYGDFNYDGQVDNTTDLNLWTANYGLSTTAGNFAPAFQPTGILINPTEGVPFSGDIATFTDLLNPSNTDPSIYQAQVNWGNGNGEFDAAQVTATATPGSFRINALSPALTDPNAVMAVIIKYADMNDFSPTYQGRPAAVSEPITMTPAVANLTATGISTSEIDLAWTLNAPNASAIEVDRSTDGINWVMETNSLPGGATSYSDTTGLAEATHYYYRVAAIWSAGPSAFTSTADAWTLANAPSALSASSNGSNEVDLSWTNNSAVATQFQIERSDDGTNFYTLDTATGTTYSDTFADDGSTYWYRVEALNDNGDPSAPSTASSTSTALAAPSELTATAVSASEIDLAWSDDSVTATGYEVDRSTDGVNFARLAPNLPADATSYSDTGLDAGSHFYYHVISVAGGQVSNPSNKADDTTAPPAPGSNWVSTTSSSVTVNWDPAQGASSYEVDRSVNGGWVDVADITDGSTTSFTDTGLLADTSFSYQIIAKNKAGQASPEGVSATTSADKPAAPSNLQAIVLSPTSVELIWTNNATNEQGFRIDKSDDSGFSWTNLGGTGPGTTNYIDSGLTPGQTRNYEVVAYNSAGDSGADGDSASLSITAPNRPAGSLQVPQPPTGLVATSGTNLIQLSWTASQTAGVQYWVQRQIAGGNWGTIGITTGTTYSDNPQLFGIDFNYRIVAANAEYTSAPTDTKPAMKQWPAPQLATNGTLYSYEWHSGYKATIFWDPLTYPESVDGYSFSYTTGGVTTTVPVGASAHAVTVTASAADQHVSYTLVASKGGLSTTYYGGVDTQDLPSSGDQLSSALVDSQGNLTVTPSTAGSVEYTDDPSGNTWLGVLGVPVPSVPLGVHLWARSVNAEGNIVPLNAPDQVPALPQIGNLNENTVGADATDYTPPGPYYNWGALAAHAGAQMKLSVNDNSFYLLTTTGGNSLSFSPDLDGPVFEGSTVTAHLHQYQSYSTPGPTGYSDWQDYKAINVMPFAPLKLTTTVIGGGKVRLLWAEGSEGETSQTIQWSTNDFTTIAGSQTVAADTTTWDTGPLTPGTYAFRIRESNAGSGTDPAGANSDWTWSSSLDPTVSNTTTNVSISGVLGAAEVGPDNHPQDGFFKITRTGPTDAAQTVNIDLSGTAGLGTQYTTDAGGASPVQLTIPANASAVLLEVEPVADGLNDPPFTTVTATLEAQAGITVTGGQATINIMEPLTLGSVTVSGPGGSATAPNETPVELDLYAPQIQISSSKITISSPGANGHVLWNLAGSNNSSTGMIPSFGQGNPAVALSPSGGNQIFTVTVGVDKNGNGVLDSSEVARTILVKLVTTLPLLIDANNDDALIVPTPDNTPVSEQRTFDDTSEPGKLISINTGDKDSDGIPDYADGYNLFKDQSSSASPPTADQGAGFVPVTLQLPSWVDPASVQLTFTYSASDPNLVTRSGTGSDDNPYTYTPAEGDLRLWTKDEVAQRNAASVGQGGDWIKPDESFPASNLEGTTIYVEAVRPSTTLADDAITVTISGAHLPMNLIGTVHLTAFGMQYDQVDTNGKIEPATQPQVSQPSPVIQLTDYTLENVRFSSDYTQILADIHIAGTVTDAASDLISGTDGTIYTADVTLNGGDTSLATLNLQVSKSDGINSLMHPYAYSGSFDQTLVGIVVDPGWNLIHITATNAYNLTGYAEASMEVNVNPDNTDIMLSQDPYSAQGNAQITITYTRDGQATSDTLTQNPNQPQLWGNVLGSIIIDTTGAGGGNETLHVTDTGREMDQDVNFTKDTNGVMHGTFIPDPEEQDDYLNSTVSAGGKGAVSASTGGELHGLVMQMTGPDVIGRYFQSVTVNGIDFKPTYDQQVLLLRNVTSGIREPDVELLMLNVQQSLQAPLPAVPPGVGRYGLSYYVKGFGAGLADTGLSIVDGIKSLGKAVWNAQPPVFIYHLFNGQIAQQARQGMQNVKAIAAVANVVYQLVVNKSQQITTDLILGNNTVINALGEGYTKAFEVAAQLLGKLKDWLDDLDDYQTGRISGNIIGQVLVMITTAGAGEIAELSQAVILQKLLPALSKIDGLAPALAKITEFIGELTDGLSTTNMCFVAGTPVHTELGLRAIESIQAGERVLARDSQTGEQAYKVVLQKIITHPTRLYHVTFRTQAGKDETLVCTGEHPFHVADLGKFVPAKKLRADETLTLAEGCSARVLSIVAEEALGQPHTTYNFEVEDFHTYFVGQTGVWVHNAGGLCERMFSLYQQIVDTRGLQNQPWEAFKILLEKTAGMSKRIDKALPDTVNEVMTQIYQKAVRADGTIDAAVEVPSYADVKAVMSGRLKPGNLQVNHTIPRYVQKLLGITDTAIQDSVPAEILEQADHTGKGPLSFHNILYKYIPLRTLPQQYSNAQLMSLLQQAYAEFGEPNVWTIANKWFISPKI